MHPLARYVSVLAVGVVTVIAVAPTLAAQRAVVLRELSAPEAASAQHYGNIFSVRQIARGHVLLNDGVNRQLVELDEKLSRTRVILDSLPTTEGNSYGPVATPLVAYVGDSSLFVDGASSSLLLIDGHGKIVRTIAAPSRNDFRFLAGSMTAVDATGHLFYRASTISSAEGKPTANGNTTMIVHLPDSAAIVQANFDTRTLDTIAHVRQQSGSRVVLTRLANGTLSTMVFMNPLDATDEWAALSDGSIALLRGHDYHVDVRQANGNMLSSEKLPFDWKPITEIQKQQLVDSLQQHLDAILEDARQTGDTIAMQNVMITMTSRYSAGMSAFMSPVQARSTQSPGAARTPVKGGAELRFVPIAEIADYSPPFHSGAMKADLDGNAWILPATSRLSKSGELIYDVVNNRGALIERVRMPVGRSLAGFGPAGTIYVMSRDASGWVLERVRRKD